MTFDDVRKIALAWPGGRGRNLLQHTGAQGAQEAAGTAEGGRRRLVMPGVPFEECDMLVESQPKVFYFTDHYRDYPIVLIRLSMARRSIVEPLLRRHWRTLASKAAVRGFDTQTKQ